MHNCREIRKNLHELALGQLEGDTALQIEQHLGECEECRRIFDAEKLYCENIGAVSSALSTLPKDKDLSKAVTDVIQREKDNPPVYVSRRRFPMATAAALVLIMLIAVFAGRMGLTKDESFTADITAGIAPADNGDAAVFDTANDQELIGSARFYSAVTDDAVPEAVNAPAEFYDEIAPEEKAEVAESDGYSEVIKEDKPIMMMSAAPPAAAGGTPDTENAGQAPEYAFATDTATTAPESDDPALNVHKKIAEYNDFINSEALILLYPQVILHGNDSEFYYNNFVRNNCGGPLIENTNFYCLHLTFDSLKSALDLCGITDYTVIQPEDPTRTDMVYIYYK